MMDKILKEIEDYGIVPVVRIEKAEDALPLGKALCEGGLPLAEITFRTAAAEEVIRPVAGTENEKDGKTIHVYLDREIAGFAIHLRQKG